MKRKVTFQQHLNWWMMVILIVFSYFFGGCQKEENITPMAKTQLEENVQDASGTSVTVGINVIITDTNWAPQDDSCLVKYQGMQVMAAFGYFGSVSITNNALRAEILAKARIENLPITVSGLKRTQSQPLSVTYRVTEADSSATLNNDL